MRKLVFIVLVMFISACEDKTTNPVCVLEPDNSAKSYGCGNIFIYQYLDNAKVLTIKIDAQNVSLTKKPQAINLDNNNPYIDVVLEVAGNDPDSIYFNFCNDILIRNKGTTLKYKAISGELTFSVSEDNPIKEPVWESLYYVSVNIKNLHLYNEAKKKEILINEIVFSNVRVGWLPG